MAGPREPGHRSNPTPSAAPTSGKPPLRKSRHASTLQILGLNQMTSKWPRTRCTPPNGSILNPPNLRTDGKLWRYYVNMTDNSLRVLICGTGAASHALASVISVQPGVELSVYTRSPEKAHEWTQILRKMQLTAVLGGRRGEIVAKSFLVTNDPERAARGCDIVIMSLPAFVHASYFAMLCPYLEPGCVIVGLPGQCGFEFELQRTLGDRSPEFTIVNFNSLPWVCRIEAFGRTVSIAGAKESIVGAKRDAAKASRIGDPVPILQRLLGSPPKLVVSEHFLSVMLGSVNAPLHPPIMYSRWKDWDGSTLDHRPLFYELVEEFAASVMTRISEELVATAQRIMTACPGLDLSDIIPKHEWYIQCYGPAIVDKSSLLTAIRTNGCYASIQHPMTEVVPGEFVPNFHHRFLTEDIPCGLAVLRGVSEIVGVPTPAMDEVIRWSQERLGKEYLTQRGLAGSDLGETRCPQRYGFATLDDILDVI